MTDRNSRNRLQSVYILNQTTHWLIVGIFIPVNALLVVEKGLDLFQLGVVLAFYSGTTLLLEPPTGGLADSIGSKKVYLISLAAQLLAVVSLLLAGGFLTHKFHKE